MREPTPASVVQWLMHGQRGVSSSFMVAWLFSNDMVAAARDYGHPHDGDDLRRCMLLAEACPEIAARISDMANASEEWAALAAAWPTLVALFESEVPDWRMDRFGRSAPKTYEAMKAILHPIYQRRRAAGERRAEGEA